MYTTSPAFQECILFLLSSRQLLKTCLAGSCEKPAQKLTTQLPSAPGKISPARILPLPRSPASPRPHSAAFSHLLSSGHSSGGRGQACQAPAHPTSFPQPFQGRRWTTAFDSATAGKCGRTSAFRDQLQAAPPHRNLGTNNEKMRKKGCAGVLEGARPQPRAREPGPKPLFPGARCPGPSRPVPPFRPGSGQALRCHHGPHLQSLRPGVGGDGRTPRTGHPD